MSRLKVWLGAAAAITCLACVGATSAGAAQLKMHSADGLTIVSQRWVNSRLVHVTVRTPAVPATLGIDVLLPVGYTPLRRFPVLYLFDGPGGSSSDWVAKGKVQKTIGNNQVLTVMPDISVGKGGGGWCVNWANGTQSWETFHIDELLPWVQSNFSTIASRAGRAIGGVSEGGYCALAYAAQYPDLFSSVLSFSGIPDIASSPAIAQYSEEIIGSVEALDNDVPVDAIFGSPSTNELFWKAHDPASLLTNLRWTRMVLLWGSGGQGPLDPLPNPVGSTIESVVNADNTGFQQLVYTQGGFNAYFDSYGPGTASWPYWTRDLQWTIGPLMNSFAAPPAPPAKVTYMSDAARYTQWGWSVAITRDAPEFSTLSNAGKGGFSLSGSGSAVVRTPAFYTRGRRYRVLIRSGSGTKAEILRAARNRTLTVQLTLGPSNVAEEYSPAATAAGGTHVDTTKVSISATAAIRRLPRG